MNIGLGMILCMTSVLLVILVILGIYEAKFKKPLLVMAGLLFIIGMLLCTGIYDPFAHHIR